MIRSDPFLSWLLFMLFYVNDLYLRFCHIHFVFTASFLLLPHDHPDSMLIVRRIYLMKKRSGLNQLVDALPVEFY